MGARNVQYHNRLSGALVGSKRASVADTNKDTPARARPLYKLPVLRLKKPIPYGPAKPPKFAMEVITIRVRESAEIEAALMWLGRELGSGLIVPLNPSMNEHRKLMVELAARHHLPTMSTLRAAATEGGLISYGIDVSELFREAAGYADRIFRGEKPAELPVQQPTKFELVINLKTAKALGLSVPVALQAGADEVIE